MKTAVWDTYVKRKNGRVLHFDIIVPEALKDAAIIYGYGKNYLAQLGEAEGKLDLEECQFCHIEEPTAEMIAAINNQGYFILEMDEIPEELPAQPTRRDFIMHLKGHHKQYRFVNFSGKTVEEIAALIPKAK